MDSGWLKALDLPKKTSGGVFVTCVVLYVIDPTGQVILNDIGRAARPVHIVITVLSGCMFFAAVIASAVEAGKAWWKRRADIKAMDAKREAAVAHLDQLSDSENHLAAKALMADSPSITDWAHSSAAGQLRSKGLLYSPVGSFHENNWPYIFPDFAWKEIQNRRDQIIERDRANQAQSRRRR